MFADQLENNELLAFCEEGSLRAYPEQDANGDWHILFYDVNFVRMMIVEVTRLLICLAPRLRLRLRLTFTEFGEPA